MKQHTTSLNEYITTFIREADYQDTCCGIAYIVDGHGEPNATLFTHDILGMALTLHIESYVHCPVCDKYETMVTQFRIADNKVDIINES